jgi:hypothetical protein
MTTVGIEPPFWKLAKEFDLLEELVHSYYRHSIG